MWIAKMQGQELNEIRSFDLIDFLPAYLKRQKKTFWDTLSTNILFEQCYKKCKTVVGCDEGWNVMMLEKTKTWSSVC